MKPMAWCVALLALVGGCSRLAVPAPVVVVVLVRLPVGANMQQVDGRIAPMAMEMAKKADGVQAVETVGRGEELEVYVQVRAQQPVASVRHAFESGALGALTKMEFATLSGPMPVVVPGVKPRVKVTIDRQRAAALGISQEETDGGLARAGADSTPDVMREIQLKTRDGQTVPLSAVAKIEMEAQPDCVVNRWP